VAWEPIMAMGKAPIVKSEDRIPKPETNELSTCFASD